MKEAWLMAGRHALGLQGGVPGSCPGPGSEGSVCMWAREEHMLMVSVTASGLSQDLPRVL